MLRNTKELYGHPLVAADGPIGHVQDFYFDDKTWKIRYVVADTGSWLTGRLILLSPQAFGPIDPAEKIFHVKLNKQQIEQGPPLDAHRAVSRLDAIDHPDRYGWPAYRNGAGVWGIPDLPGAGASLAADPRPSPGSTDQHLQSAQAIVGYSIQSVDGAIGTVTGFLVDDKCWIVRELVVEIGHWYSSKEITIAPERVESVSYDEAKVFVNLTRLEILRAAPFNFTRAGAPFPPAANFQD